MKQILKLVFLLVIGQTAFAQAPSNYTNINGRYRWIAGMFDSTFHIPKGSTPSLRTGGSTNSGGLFYNTSDSSVYTYTGTQWIKLRGSINPSDTTNKYVTQVYKKNASDSVFYVKGGNHLFAFIDSVGSPGGGGGGKIYYFNGGVSMGTIGGLQMYELGDTANTGAAANFTRSTTGNIANFITDPNKPGLLQIPAGVWSVDAWLSETGGGANHAEIWVEVEKWDGSTITTIATSPIEQITEGATPNLYSWSVSIPTTSLSVTDRIIIQFYISNTNGKTVTLYTQNGYVGEVHTTFTTGIGAINGLTAPAQYLVTGTSGTDFNINSATATHTFNLPTASATNRGALSTTDWSTFNNKIGGSLVSGYLTKATGTNTIDTSQIYQTNGKIGIGRTNPTAKVDVYDSLGTSIKSTMRAQINTDVALDVKTVGNRGFALIIDQADSVASGTQYQTLFRKSMMPGTGNPANGGGVSWYTQIGNDNNVYRALSVYRARVIDSTGFANSNIQQTSTEFWTRKAGVWDTTLVLNGGNVGINTGQNGIDSALTVANGTLLKRGVRMTALPTGVGTKAVRIDANGTLSVADTLANGISGTGTTNYIPKFTSSSAIGNSQIFDNGTNVGINTASPVAMLDVNGAGVIRGFLTTTDAIKLGANTSAPTSTDAFIYRPADNTLAFGTASSERMRLTSGGLLGLGTSSPSNKLTVQVSAGQDAINWNDGARNGYLYVDGAGVGVFSGAGATNQGIYLNNTSSYLAAFTSGSERMRLDASGNLLVGGTSGDGKLYVQTSTAVAYSSIDYNGTNANLRLKSGGSPTTNTTAGISFGVGGSAEIYIGAVQQANTYANLVFQTFGPGAVYSTKMTLDASGNLGLGITPSAWASFTGLQVGETGSFASNDFGSGNIQTFIGNNVYYDAVGFKYIQAGSARMLRMTSDNFNWEIAGSGSANGAISFTQAMTLDASGRLGIGATSPGYRLEVNGDIGFSGGASLKWGGNTYIYGSNNVQLEARVNGNLGWYINSSGNVGIGTTSPTYKLDITANNNASIAIAETSDDPFIWFDRSDGGSSRLAWRLRENATRSLIFETGSSATKYGQTFTEAMRITSGGQVGIGTSSPAQALQVNTSTGNAYIRVERASQTTGQVGLQIGGGTSSTDWFTYMPTSSNDLAFFGNSSERMRITSGGNVGIGTSSPTQLLTLEGADGYLFTVQENGANKSRFQIYQDDGGSSLVAGYNSTATNMYFYTGSTERMRITSGGLVGIGTSAPSVNLQVQSASAPEMRITDGTIGYQMYAQTGSNDMVLGTYTNHNLLFRTNAQARMLLSAAGELLINTTSDAGDYKLQVNGNVYSTGYHEIQGTGLTASYRIKNTTATTGKDWHLYSLNNGNIGIYDNTSGYYGLTITSSGNTELYGSIKTAAPSGGTAKPWKFGEAGVSVGGANTTAVKVEIDGVVYYLLTAYLPEPAPESAPKPKPEG